MREKRREKEGGEKRGEGWKEGEKTALSVHPEDKSMSSKLKIMVNLIQCTWSEISTQMNQ